MGFIKINAETNKTLKVSGVFIGIMVGAGFASGRELLAFFARHGTAGAVGFAVACGVLTLCGWAVMDIAHRRGISGYGPFMAEVLGPRLAAAAVCAVNVFIFIMMTTMFAGFAESAKTAYSLPYTAGVVVIAALCFVTFMFDLKGIIGVSSFLTPVLIVGVLFFGAFASSLEAIPVFLSGVAGKAAFLWPAAIYASYNLLTAVSVLSAASSQITSPKIALRAALLSGFVILVLGMSFLTPIYLHFPAIKDLPIPLLALAERGGGAVKTVYAVVLFAAAFTSSVTSGFAVIAWLEARFPKLPRLCVKLAVTIASAALAHVGFKVFIERVYPVFGYIGLFEIAAILVYFGLGRKDIRAEKLKSEQT